MTVLAVGLGSAPPTEPTPAVPMVATDDRSSAESASLPILIHGTAEQQRVAHWALDRFADAGLDLPPLDINFHDTEELCLGASGLAGGTETRRVAHICKPNNPPRVVLHELAHIWTDTHLDQSARDAFVEIRGARSWNTEGTWPERAAEHASEIIMWALLDQKVILFASLGDRDPASLADHYQILTGLDTPQWDNE